MATIAACAHGRTHEHAEGIEIRGERVKEINKNKKRNDHSHNHKESGLVHRNKNV